MTPPTKKFVTAEFHDGWQAYERGQALTANPYLNDPTVGRMFYWDRGYLSAMADDIRSIKQTIVAAAQPIDKRKMN